MFKGEQVFFGEDEVKYIYQESYNKTKSLVIIFSAFPARNKGASYNFIHTLEGIDCNKLFILDDFGSRASYYLCKNKEFFIEKSVIALIKKIVKENDIQKVIACGSSKGGSAAIYYGAKYGFDYVIAGSPQYYLGEYLINQAKAIREATFMSGGTDGDSERFLNSLLPSVLNASNSSTEFFIHAGEREIHYEVHIKPLLNTLRNKKVEYVIDLGDYDKHTDVAKFFPPLLKSELIKYLGYPTINIKNPINKTIPNNSNYDFKIESNSSENRTTWYLYRNDKKIEQNNKYSYQRKFRIYFKEKGVYRVKFFMKNSQGLRVSESTKPIKVI